MSNPRKQRKELEEIITKCRQFDESTREFLGKIHNPRMRPETIREAWQKWRVEAEARKREIDHLWWQFHWSESNEAISNGFSPLAAARSVGPLMLAVRNRIYLLEKVHELRRLLSRTRLKSVQ